MINFNAVAGVLRRTPSALAIASAAMALGSAAQASLTEFQTYNGNVAVSTDGWGGLDGNGIISASAPNGSNVIAAYLYTATVFLSNPTTPTTVTLNGSNVSPYTSLGDNPIVPSGDLTAYRTDVTSIVAPIINGGGGPVYDFTIDEGSQNGIIDGHALVVVYENAALPDASVGILDGFSATTGDTTAINFSEPLDPTDPGFFAEMALGISFSCCGQDSTVTVNGTLLSENAGNKDDGENGNSNGNLITVGGFDDPLNSGGLSYADDRERYDLSGFVNLGDTSITVDTFNPTNDDNIFLATFYVSGDAGFNEPPPNAIPLPAPMLMLLTGLAGLGAVRRRRKSA